MERAEIARISSVWIETFSNTGNPKTADKAVWEHFPEVERFRRFWRPGDAHTVAVVLEVVNVERFLKRLKGFDRLL